MTTFLQTLSGGENDARENDAGGSFDGTSSTLAFFSNTSASSRFNLGLRFTTVSVPGGATIDAGTKLQVQFNDSNGDSPNAQIHGETTGNPGSFTDNADVTSRARTTAFVNWVDTDVGTDTYIDTPDIDTEIQEVIDGTWSVNDALVMFMDGNDDTNINNFIYAEEHANNVPAKIVIEYTAGGGAGTIVPTIHHLASLRRS